MLSNEKEIRSKEKYGSFILLFSVFCLFARFGCGCPAQVLIGPCHLWKPCHAVLIYFFYSWMSRSMTHFTFRFPARIPTHICLLDTSSFVSSFLTFRYLNTTWAGRACTTRWIRHHEFHGLPVKLIDTPKCDCIALWVFFLFPRWYSLYFFSTWKKYKGKNKAKIISSAWTRYHQQVHKPKK